MPKCAAIWPDRPRRVRYSIASAAAEAVIELLRRADGEGGRFFVMKGAAGAEVGTRFFQLQMAMNNVDDIDAIEQIAFKGIGNHARSGLGSGAWDLSKHSPASAPRNIYCL